MSRPIKDPSASASGGISWGAVALFGLPGVALAIWFMIAQSADLKDGEYSCAPELSLGGMFWSATVANSHLVDMKWDGPGAQPVSAFSLDKRHGSGEFTATVDGRAVTCTR